MSSPCLVVFAALRSGTTMLRLMLDAHPQMSCTGEHDFLFDFLSRTPDGWAYDHEALRNDWLFRQTGFVVRDDLDGLDLMADLIGQIGAQGGGRPVLMLHRNLHQALELLPEVPLVHMLRDPRDVARSAIGMLWANHVYFGADTWLKTETEWEKHSTAVEGRTLTIRYEDLVERPQDTLAALCRHVGLPFDDRMLTYDQHSTYDRPDPALARQWRRKLTPEEVRLVEGKVGPLLASRGYEPAGAPPLVPSPFQLLRLRLGNRLGLWRRMARIYGWSPLLRRRLGRAFGLDGVRRGAEQEIEAILLKRLK